MFYKIFTKVIINILKPLLPLVIIPNQISFIYGYKIVDNIIIAMNLYTLRGSRKVKKVFLALKVNLEKARDRIRWDFLKDTLLDIGLPVHFINIIMNCISISSMQIIWKDKLIETFCPLRGLR